MIRQDEVILRAKQFIYHLDCFTCVTCHLPLHPGDEFGLKDELIFCRQHYFEQQQQLSYDPHISGRMLEIENHSIGSGFLDDSGYYASPIPNLLTSTPSTNTSTPSGTGTINLGKRTRKRKERQQIHHQHDELISSSDHFLTLSPSSSNLGMFSPLNQFSSSSSSLTMIDRHIQRSENISSTVSMRIRDYCCSID